MSLASIVAVACALLVPGLRDAGAQPRSQAQSQEKPQESPPPTPSFPVQTTPGETAQPKTAPADSATPKKPAIKKVTAKKKAPIRKKPGMQTATASPDGTPEKRVVRNGSATDPTTQISPSMPPQQASTQMQDTNNLLTTADANLKSLSSAQLNATQEDMVKQIKTYMEQARSAVGAGDLERANNLATKAQLLSAELVKK